ncbi:gliding motility-associated C-terminal domain-containing protein [Tenacibaculum maritimum]|uniref:T9SS type B sorting domain-containing protein n=1 Tax=Tenacibaculum maritimum TaxID=107401 RepID=UPI003890CCFB
MNKKYFFFQKKTFRNSFLFIGMMVFSLSLFSQGATCPTAEVLCTPNAAFPAETSAPDLGSLPSCGTSGVAPGYPVSPTLSTTPNPAFYTLQVVQSGDLYLFINTSPQADVDFAIWGPFSDPNAVNNCQGGNFPPGVPIDCDYSSNKSEQIDVPGVLAGESYILMITNYEGLQTDITLSPNNDHGTNTAVLGGPLAFQVSAAGPYTTGDTPVDLAITPEASNPNVSGVSFSGTGIIDTTNGTFDPVAAGVGTHRITVTGTSYECVVSTEIDIVVNDKCDPVTSGNLDSDNDGVSDVCDLDDDNDGILDTVEYESCNAASFRLQGLFDDFGTGTTRTSTPYISNSYSFISTGNTVDGGYCIINTPNPGAADYASWGTYGDHTPGDIDGKMLIINAANLPGEFYRRSLTGIIPNTKAELSFWTRDICGNNCTVTPNVTYSILDSSNNVLATATTGNFPSSDWLNYKLTVDVGTNTELQFVLINNAPGGGGNDLAIDDISFTNIVCDADNDGIPNHLDLDSDNDGCNDAIESGGADVNDDGLVDGDGVNSSGQVTTGGVILGTSYNGTTGREDVATRVIVDATSLVNQAVLNGNPVTFGITSAIATSTTVFTGTAPSTTPNYADASAMNVSGAIVYQWQEDGVDLSNTGVYSGVNTTTLTISNVTGLDGKVYKLVVTHPDNPCTRIVNEATLKVIPIIDAVDDNFTGSPVTAGDNTASVVGNDTLDGSGVVIGTGVGEVSLSGVTVPVGLTLNGDGTVSVATGTPSGSYAVVYDICENGATPVNCDRATATIVVANPIDAVDDNFTGSPVTAGDNTSSVLDNDTLDGSGVVIGTGAGEVSLSGVTVPAGLTLNGDGTVSVATGTPSGSYAVVYDICENGATPVNCDRATATIVVANPIDAVDDDFTGSPVTAGDNTSSVLDNDTLDGSGVVIGTGAGEVSLSGVTVPAGLTLNGDGTVSVATGTPSGSYAVVYDICENGATPVNCDRATATIVVANPIDAVDDNFTGSPVTAGDNTSSVVGNDTLDGSGVVIGTGAGEVSLSGVTVPAGLTLNGDGTVSVATGTPSGSYAVVYDICENGATPVNCDRATATIVVANPIDAVDDDFTGSPVTAGDNTSSVLDNDTLDGSGVVIGTGAGEVSLSGVTVPAGLTLNGDGTVSVATGTASGSYAVVYDICENGATPVNCDRATATIVVANPIDAVDDDFTGSPVTAGDNTSSVLDNDTLDGSGVVIGTGAGEVSLSGVTVPAGLTLNGDGTVSVATGTPSGSYAVVYDICENGATPVNCDRATATIVVANPIDAVDDDFTGSPVTAGDNTSSVVGNDTLDGSGVVIGTGAGEVSLSGVTVPAGLTLNGDGTVSVATGTPSGSYAVVYDICENGATPVNCDRATATIVVANPIDAVDDNFTGSPVTAGDNTSSVVGNDTLDGSGVVIGTGAGEVSLSGVTVPAGLTLNGDGTVSVATGTPSGSYAVVYDICENGATPVNCDRATATIVVANPIDAVDDDFTGSPVTAGDNTSSVLDNDTLDGSGVVIGTGAGEVSLSGVTVPAGLTLNGDGTVSVATGTASGSYAVVYDICENGATPVNCDRATATIVVANPIDAVDDDFTGSPVTAGDNTSSVLDNDTLDGSGVVIGTGAGEVSLSGVTVPAGLTLNGDGTVTIDANTPAGNYTIVYDICENGATPVNCDRATAIIVVVPPVIEAVVDTVAGVDGLAGGTTPALTGNDTLNGVPVNIGTGPGDVVLTPDNVPAGLTLNADGTVTVAPGTPAGSYDVEYTICEVTNPMNCSSVISVVNVLGAPIVANNDTDASGLDTVNGFTGGIAGDVTENDTLNGVLVDDNDILITVLNEGGLTGVSIDGSGNLIVPSGTPSGSYTVTYQICEVLNPGNCDTATALVVVEPDTDGDGVVDSVDLDDDNDGILDVIEENGTPGLDTDNDGIPDTLDLDSDGDGILDIVESGQDAGSLDTDGDGVLDSTTDLDGDGIVDTADADDTNPSGGGKVNPVDTDNDGSPDFQDIDDDGDGVNTIDENPDPNTDGSVTDAQDTDNDGIPDYLDTDDDGDGVNTIDENPDPNTDSIITDAQDTDNDGVPDYLDTDDDGDGVNTIDENPDPNTDGSVTDAQDTDNDGIPDYLDTDETVTIYNEFTPNGDGDNDTFYIEFIERYPNNNLEIYNRWGNLVYSKKGYDNTFKGVSNGRLNIDENSKLPVGTYFYVLDLGESGKEPLKGWLYINR